MAGKSLGTGLPKYRYEKRISLRHGIPLRLPLPHPPKISQYLWPGQIKWHERPHRQGEHARDICGCELISSRPRRLSQPRIEQPQHISESRIHISTNWMICGSLCSPGHHFPSNRRLHAGIREVKPVEIVGIIWVAWWKDEAPIAVFVDDVFCYRATFCEREGPVGYYDSGAKGRQRFE
jgi:hypothetical protein